MMNRFYLKFTFVLFFSPILAFGLHRDAVRGGELRCAYHAVVLDEYQELEQYISLIPPIRSFCSYCKCSQCNSQTWLTEVVNDYSGDDEEEGGCYYTSYDYVCDCIPPPWESRGKRFPPLTKPDSWKYCRSPAIYEGYFSPNNKKYFSFFINHLIYSKENIGCKCYWPEISLKSAVINDIAYGLFLDLFSNTALSELESNRVEQASFFFTQHINMKSRDLSIICICNSFYFSSYYYICKDLNSYATARYNNLECKKIRKKLYNILNTLSPLFHDVYENCLCDHPNQVIRSEMQFLESL